jgi:hypothetical protein
MAVTGRLLGRQSQTSDRLTAENLTLKAALNADYINGAMVQRDGGNATMQLPQGVKQRP